MRPPPTAHRTPAATSPDLTGESRVRIHGAHGWREFEWSNGAVHRYEWKHFEVCCIPFFLYDVSLGDVVATNPDYVLDRVVRASGRYTFRV